MSEFYNAVTCIETIPSPGNLKKKNNKKDERKKWVRMLTDAISGDSNEMADRDISFKVKNPLRPP